jgi:hypothetical protein
MTERRRAEEGSRPNQAQGKRPGYEEKGARPNQGASKPAPPPPPPSGGGSVSGK